eukprot:116139-Amphidinium_carterae.1
MGLTILRPLVQRLGFLRAQSHFGSTPKTTWWVTEAGQSKETGEREPKRQQTTKIAMETLSIHRREE